MNSPSETSGSRSVAAFGGAIIITFLAEANTSDGRFSLYEITCEPGSGPPLHVHSDVDETFYVLDGTFRFQIGDERHHAPAGWFGQGPRHIPHAFTACGPRPAKLLMVVSPAGLEDFFTELGELTSAQPVEPAEVTTVFEKYNMTIVGPPVPVEDEPATA